jgi:hypothetical protein
MRPECLPCQPALALPDVTLCCIDTRSVDQALYAIQRSMAQVRFGQVLFLAPPPQGDQAHRIDGMEWRVISTLQTIEDYNRAVLHDLADHVRTPYALIVQWDGFVTTADMWRPEFLTVDYIGAPWYHGGHSGKVGNGGFSLRSKRLLDKLSAMHLDFTQPEDAVICEQRRAELENDHGIRFAPLEMAQAFGCEYGAYRRTFGFHGMHNFAHVMSRADLDEWVTHIPNEILRHKHTRKLIKELMLMNRSQEAVQLLRRRSQLLGWTGDQVVLYLRAHMHRLKIGQKDSLIA